MVINFQGLDKYESKQAGTWKFYKQKLDKHTSKQGWKDVRKRYKE